MGGDGVKGKILWIGRILMQKNQQRVGVRVPVVIVDRIERKDCRAEFREFIRGGDV